MIITEEQLAAWERLCDEATAGPWVVGITVDQNWGQAWPVFRIRDMDDTSEEAARKDARLIEDARTALPVLLAEVRRLREENERLKDTVALANMQQPDYEEMGRQHEEIAKQSAELHHWRDAAASVGETDGHGWAMTTEDLRGEVARLTFERDVLAQTHSRYGLYFNDHNGPHDEWSWFEKKFGGNFCRGFDTAADALADLRRHIAEKEGDHA